MMEILAYFYGVSDMELPDLSGLGIDPDRIFTDQGDRTQLQTLLTQCETHPPDYLILRRLEELGDTPETVQNHITQLDHWGIEIITLTPQTPLVQLLNHLQKQEQNRRLRQGHARKRLKTLPPPGKAPYGYRRGKERYILDRSTAPLVKAFFDRYLLFGSLRGAVRFLEKKYGKKISVTTGRRWLTNVVYRGHLQYQNGDIIPNTHIPILSQEEAAQIDRLLRRNRRLPPRTASAPRSLAGLVVCQQCQSPTTITRTTQPRKAQEYLYLRPVNCPLSPKCKSLPYPEVLQCTIEHICQELPKAVAGKNLPPFAQVKNAIASQIEEKQQIIQTVHQLEAEGILDEETADLRRYKLNTEIAQLQDQQAQLPPENLMAIAQTVSLPEFWLDLSEAERRFYFREFIKQIYILREGSGHWDLQLVFIFNL